MSLTRRDLLATAAAGGLLSVAPGLNVSFGAEAGSANEVLVFLFLRFGMDGLSLVSPADDANYHRHRPLIALNSSGPGAGLRLDTWDGVDFFMHPSAGQLRQMYRDKTLAIIHASGVPTENRSHFETQDMVGKGIADNEPVQPVGWLARHLLAKSAVRGDFEAVADGTGLTTSLDGLGGTLSFASLSTLGGSLYGNFATAIGAMHRGDSELELSVQKALRAAAVVRQKASTIPPSASGNYTYGPLSAVLRPLAQIVKLDIGVQVATADFGGWDHHNFILNAFPQQARELSDSLFAFFDDLGPVAERVTVVAMTEFGRRVYENANNGTDHGAGSAMLVMGAGVNGGKFYGAWPGLRTADLDQGDLRITTDYRQVLAELLVKRQGQAAIGQVFPTVAYKPLGILRDRSGAG
jgi:uncharacterized protein (DUF1501 family)